MTTLTVGGKDWRLIQESKSETRLLIFLMNILAGEVFSLGLEKARVVRKRWGGEDGMGQNGAGGASHGLRGGAVVVVVGGKRSGWGGNQCRRRQAILNASIPFFLY